MVENLVIFEVLNLTKPHLKRKERYDSNHQTSPVMAKVDETQ